MVVGSMTFVEGALATGYSSLLQRQHSHLADKLYPKQVKASIKIRRLKQQELEKENVSQG